MACKTWKECLFESMLVAMSKTVVPRLLLTAPRGLLLLVATHVIHCELNFALAW